MQSHETWLLSHWLTLGTPVGRGWAASSLIAD